MQGAGGSKGGAAPKAAAAGVSPSDLLRQAMARVRTWTAAATQVERERTRQVARIGDNLNQIARWANTQATPDDAFELIARLIAIERATARLAGLGDERQDERGPNPLAPRRAGAHHRPSPARYLAQSSISSRRRSNRSDRT